MGKYCKKCIRYLELENFYKTKNKTYIDGAIDWCKECLKHYRNERRDYNKQINKSSLKNFFIENKEYVIHFD